MGREEFRRARSPTSGNKVVIVGAGFGGLWAAKGLARAPVDVLLVDRNNYHTFLPLAYQVAAAELSPDETVTPVRGILRRLPNVRFVMATVLRVDPERHVLECEDRQIPYDYLVLAPGSTPHFFNIPGAEEHAYPLRTLEDAVRLRNHILRCFEMAAVEQDASVRKRLLTFVVVGGGPTGVEFASALSELIRGPLRRDFPSLDLSQARILLIEGKESPLPGLPSPLPSYARERLARKGVEVRTGSVVTEITPESVTLRSGETLATRSVVWTAGHRGHPLAEASGLMTNRQGQVVLKPTLQAPDYPNIYVVGDLAYIPLQEPLPMIAPVAMQQGEHAARNIFRQMHGLKPLPFVYKDRGMMVVLGRNSAAVRLGKRTFTGFLAWLMWLFVHLVQLIGFRNRLEVLLAWGWDYVTFERHVRLILPVEEPPSPVAEEERWRRAG